jgi:HNH endonuclease/NUMOD3 motif
LHMGRYSPATIEKMRRAATGRKASPETREKMSRAQTGRRHSPESIEKMRLAKAAWWANNPEKAEACKKKISENHARPALGKRGPDAPGWKGGKYSSVRDGYIYTWMPEHPRATGSGYVLEHRLVMEKLIGRYLEPDEDVNHKNGIKDDNRPGNLMLVRHNAHYALMHCPSCGFEWGVR